MTVDIEVRSPRDAELDQILDLRYTVLDQPLGIERNISPSDRDTDPTSILVAGFIGSNIVCSVRLDPLSDTKYLVRRMATDQAFRRRGIGAKVLAEAEQIAVSRGATSFVLHARIGAVAFYESQGYQKTGVIEIHNGNENPEMTKEV